MLTDNTPRVEPAVLTSWKEIAQHLGKGVRTVQRWEQRFGLPVRRPLGAGHKSTVLARREDLDMWMSSAWARRAKAEDLPAKVGLAPVHGQLSRVLETAKVLQTTNSKLLQEVSQNLSSLITHCRELRKVQEQITAIPLTQVGASKEDIPAYNQAGRGDSEAPAPRKRLPMNCANPSS